MKRYRIFPSIFQIFFSLIWIGFVSFVLFMITGFGGEVEVEGEGSLIPVFIFVGIFEAVGVGLLLADIVYFIRRNAALRGESAMGELVEFHLDCSHNENGSHVLGYAVSFTYTMANGQVGMTSTRIPLRHVVYFQNRRQIPIKTNGKYAFYDLEALKMDVAMNGGVDHSTMANGIRGSFQSFAQMTGMGFNPYMTNVSPENSVGGHFCPKCGKEVTSEDVFCRGCGNKLN